MSVFADGFLRMMEKQREVFRKIVAMESPTEAELLAVRQLARSALDRDLGMLVMPVFSKPLSDDAAYAGWHALEEKPEVKYNETEAFVAGVRFAEQKHRVGEASEVVRMLPPAVLRTVRPLLKTPRGSIDPAVVVATNVYKALSPDTGWYCSVTIRSGDGRDQSIPNWFDTEDGAHGLVEAIQVARNELSEAHDWLPSMKQAPRAQEE